MGFFGKSDEQKAKEAVQVKIKEAGGILNAIDKEDYQRVMLAQNECIIGLLQVIGIATSGLGGDVATMMHVGAYYNEIKEVIK